MSEESSFVHNVNDWRKSCCCLKMFNAIVDGLLDARVGGMWLAAKSDGHPNGNMLKYCPYCSREIITRHDSAGHDWWFVGSDKAAYRTP